jgi:hypothetical protein
VDSASGNSAFTPSPTRTPRDASWTPGRVSWWVGVLFAVGSTCFLVGPIPGFVELVGSAVDATVFFVGSIFFTSAAVLQLVDTGVFALRRLDWWSCSVQVAGTLFFNVSTFHALETGLDATEYDRLVWTPDARGSVCFLVSGYLAFYAVCGRPFSLAPRTRQWWTAAVNLLGCIAFGMSAVAAYVVPSTGSAIDLAGANAFTALGALGFLIGAVLLLPQTGDRTPLVVASAGAPHEPLPSAAAGRPGGRDTTIRSERSADEP